MQIHFVVFFNRRHVLQPSLTPCKSAGAFFEYVAIAKASGDRVQPDWQQFTGLLGNWIGGCPKTSINTLEIVQGVHGRRRSDPPDPDPYNSAILRLILVLS